MQIAKQDIKFSFLKMIPFSAFDKWYVSYYLNPNAIKSKYRLEFLSNLISPLKVKIKKNEYKGDFPVISKISFSDGKIHLREEKHTGMDLYKLEFNQLLVSKINFHQGAVAINNIGVLVCSTHYQPYKINYSKVTGAYLTLVLRSKVFFNFIKFLRADGIKNEATYDFIGGLQIPLPSIDEQKRIINNYYNKIKKAEEQQNKSVELKKEIEKYLFVELGIKGNEEKNKIKGIHFIKYKNITKWGVEYNIGGLKKGILQSSIYNNLKLSELVYINPQTKLPNSDEEITFLPMECISDESGEIKEYRKGIVTKSKGYTKFQEGDLIWARITPCMENGKSAIVKNLINHFGYGSTEYHVFREKREDFKIDFLYHLLRTECLRKNAVSHFTGSSGQQRVPKSYLEELDVPLPPVQKQKQIIEDINKIKNEIEILKIQAEQNRKAAEKEFETEIFG